MADDVSNTLQALAELQKRPLSIIRLSEPLSSVTQPSIRSSDVSTSAIDNPTPASLEADLIHYKELFSKLRFSYLEQVTKEKFLRAIVGEPPLIVDHQENIELESQLAEVKAVLKAQKENVAAMVKELEEKGRELTRRYETIQLQTAQLSALPAHISSLNETISNLRSTLQQTTSPTSTSSLLALPLDATLSLISERQNELSDLNQRIESLQQALPLKTVELEKIETELIVLGEQKATAVQGAREAMSRRDQGLDGGDELELRGRWLKGVETGLKRMLDVEATA